MECLLQVALHPAYIKQKQKKHSVRKEPSSHARLFGSTRRIEIRRRRSAAEIDRQRNRRSAERCRFFASVEAGGRWLFAPAIDGTEAMTRFASTRSSMGPLVSTLMMR